MCVVLCACAYMFVFALAWFSLDASASCTQTESNHYNTNTSIPIINIWRHHAYIIPPPVTTSRRFPPTTNPEYFVVKLNRFLIGRVTGNIITFRHDGERETHINNALHAIHVIHVLHGDGGDWWLHSVIAHRIRKSESETHELILSFPQIPRYWAILAFGICDLTINMVGRDVHLMDGVIWRAITLDHDIRPSDHNPYPLTCYYVIINCYSYDDDCHQFVLKFGVRKTTRTLQNLNIVELKVHDERSKANHTALMEREMCKNFEENATNIHLRWFTNPTVFVTIASNMGVSVWVTCHFRSGRRR